MRGRFAEMCLERARELADGYPAGAGLVTKVEHTLSWAGAAPAGYFTALLAGERDSGARAGTRLRRRLPAGALTSGSMVARSAQADRAESPAPPR